LELGVPCSGAVLRRLAEVEAQLFQGLLEDVFAGHGCIMLLVNDVACGIGEVNAEVASGDGSDSCYSTRSSQVR